jgi:hypothetical protein
VHTYFVGEVGAWVHTACAFRPPAWHKVTLDMEHVLSGHRSYGARYLQALKDGKIKDIWPDNVSDRFIKNSIRTAFGNARIINTNPGHSRVLLEGHSKAGTRIQMWYESSTKTITSAWPKF